MSGPVTQRHRPGPGDLLVGAGYFLRGLRWVAGRPKLWLFGLVPALITLVVYVVVLSFLGAYAGDLASSLTPFADHWASGARRSLRVVAAVLIFGGALVFAVLTFTAVTLLIGEPFYESLAIRVEDEAGGIPRPGPEVPLWRQVIRAGRDALILGVLAGGYAAVFFVLGFLPVIGQTVVPVLAAGVSGYFLTGELTSIALERRGLRRHDRFILIRRNRLLSVGFGAAVFVVFLIPLGAVLAMPGAVAGGTLLARERLAA